MQFSLQTLLAAAAAAATTVAAQSSPVFHVLNFTAACIPHSALCAYDFHVFQSGSYEASLNGSVQCNATVVSNGALPAITDAACVDSSRTWSVMTAADSAGGLLLTVSQPVTPSSNQTGSHAIPAFYLNYTQTGASTQQSYTGPSEFDLF
jgi:hypothetical protein